MKKSYIILSMGIILFYFFNPILEKKELKLNTPLLILKKEPNNYYRLYDNKKNENEYKYKHLYVDGIVKYKNIWIGHIEKCYISSDPDKDGEAFPERYLRSDVGSSDIIIEDIDNEECYHILKNRGGYFYVDEKGNITYKISISDIKKNMKINKIKLKNPNYYIQKFGEKKDINEFYFSNDDTVKMHQKPSIVKKEAYKIRNVLFTILIIISIYLRKKHIKMEKKLWEAKSKLK